MVPAGMATRTLNAKYRAKDDAVNRRRLIFYHSEDKKEIYYEFEDEAEEAAPEPAATVEASPCRSRCCWTAAGLVSTIDEAPFKAVDTLRIIAAQNVKKVDEARSPNRSGMWSVVNLPYRTKFSIEFTEEGEELGAAL